jgi:ABC-type Mn2+/Zn2+ transport system permease subunit
MVVAMSTAGWVGLGIVGLIIWVALAFWPARVAGRKGHSFLGYFILSLFFFPLALVMAYVVKDRRGLAVRS